MKINNVAPLQHITSPQTIQNKAITETNYIQNRHTPTQNLPKQDALTHMVFFGLQNLKYTTNVTFKGGANKKDRGYVQVYTGDGKGKTTAAMGLALRH